MRLPTVPTTAVVDHLNTTYFRRVWNAPNDHGRANFPLAKIAVRIQTGAVPVGRSVVGLPTTDSVYAVYQAPPSVFGRFVDFPEDTWVKDTDLVNGYQTTLTVYSASGRVLPTGSIYFRYSPIFGKVFIAVSVVYTNKCTDMMYPELYCTVYKDTSRETPIATKTYIVSTIPNGSATVVPSVVDQAIYTAATACPNGTVVTINGWTYDAQAYPVIKDGDIVGVLSDPDVVGYCDITIDDNQTGYYSERYDEYRELLHIPKLLNPNNIVITNDTLTTVIFDTVTNRGIFGHRIDNDAVESVTHNDFSMGRSVLDAFSNTLQATSIKVRLYVRYPTKPNYLSDDANHMKDLYALSDSDITKQLLAMSTKQISEWKASHLEQSPFLDLIYGFNGFDKATVIPSFVNAMGYYEVASTLGQQMRFYTYKNAQVAVKKPVRLYGYGCRAIAYSNGVKIPESSVTITDYDSQHFLIGYDFTGLVKVGDKISLYVCEASSVIPSKFAPTSGTPSVIMSHPDYDVYLCYTYTTPIPVWKESVSTGYKLLLQSPADFTITDNEDGTSLFTFKPQHYGKDFYFIPKFGMDTAVYEVQDKINAGLPIVLSLKTKDSDGVLLPILAYETMEVYLNGKRLIDRLDYMCEPTIGENGDILENLLTVSCNDYFLTDTDDVNIVEVVYHGDTVVSEDKGYVVENVMHRTEPPLIWSKASSRAFVNGILQEAITEVGNTVTIGTPVPNGAPFLMQYMVSFGAGKFLEDLSPVADINLRNRIEHLLGIVPPTYPPLITLDHLHALYSPFLAQISFDVSHRQFTIVDEMSDDLFLKQFKPYAALLERDPMLLGNNPIVNRQFVSLAASYTNLVVQDPIQMQRMQRLTSLLLDPSNVSVLEVLL